jgi:hypothetical protein
LACKLASSFPNETGIEALIFDDKEAAKNLSPFPDQRHHGTYLWHLRARYVLDREKKRQFVDFVYPDIGEEGILTVKRFRVWLASD